MRGSFIRLVFVVALAALVIGYIAGRAFGYHASQASWYGPGLYGNPLGCGGRLYAGTWGVAHKTLPCGTLIRVCMRRCTTARVIDRGPYVGHRELDLTKPVADRIGLTPYGHATVIWSVVRR
jgi:rare lipoprotein A